MLIKVLLLVLLVPNEDSFNYLKSKAYASAGDPDLVISYAQKGKELAVVNSQIDSAGYYYYLFVNEIADALVQKGRLNEAVSEYELAISNKERFGRHVTLGYVYKGYGQQLEGKGQYVKAVANYEEACEIFADFNDINLQLIANDLGVLYLQLSKYQQAGEAFQLVKDEIDQQLSKDDALARHELYINKIYATINLAICEGENNPGATRAVSLIKDATDIVNSPEFDADERMKFTDLLKINEAYIHYKAGRKEDMERVWSSLQSPEKDFEYYYVSGCYNKLFGRPEEAFEDFKKTFEYSDKQKIFKPALSSIEGISDVLTRVKIPDSQKIYYGDRYREYRERMVKYNSSIDSLLHKRASVANQIFENMDKWIWYIVVSSIAVFIAVVVRRLWPRKSDCQTFYTVESRRIDMGGVTADVANKFGFKLGEVRIESKYSEATEKLQTLDILQYNLCVHINKITDREEKEKELKKLIDAQTEMMKIVLSVSNPPQLPLPPPGP